MKSMTELAGGELCLPHRPHNQVGAARRRRSFFNLPDTIHVCLYFGRIRPVINY